MNCAVTEPWTDLRATALCPICHEEHQHVVAFVRRTLRRPASQVTAQDVEWLRKHLEFAGLL